MNPMTAEWVSKAEGDYDVVCILRRSRKPNRFDTICFHCQQCVEKYLKARLYAAQIRFPKTHDLLALLDLVRPIEPLWMGLQGAFKDLADSAVVTRYPGKWTTPQDAKNAYKVCYRLRGLARESLGLKS